MFTQITHISSGGSSAICEISHVSCRHSSPTSIDYSPCVYTHDLQDERELNKRGRWFVHHRDLLGSIQHQNSLYIKCPADSWLFPSTLYVSQTRKRCRCFKAKEWEASGPTHFTFLVPETYCCNAAPRGSEVWQFCTPSFLQKAAKLPCMCQVYQPVSPCMVENCSQLQCNGPECLGLRLWGWRVRYLWLTLNNHPTSEESDYNARSPSLVINCCIINVAKTADCCEQPLQYAGNVSRTYVRARLLMLVLTEVKERWMCAAVQLCCNKTAYKIQNVNTT